MNRTGLKLKFASTEMRNDEEKPAEGAESEEFLRGLLTRDHPIASVSKQERATEHADDAQANQ